MSNPQTDKFIIFGGTRAQMVNGFPWEFYVDHADTLEEAADAAEREVSTGFDFEWFQVVNPVENRVVAFWEVVRSPTPRKDLESTTIVVGAVQVRPRQAYRNSKPVWVYIMKDLSVQNRWVGEEEPFVRPHVNLAEWHIQTTEKSS